MPKHMAKRERNLPSKTTYFVSRRLPADTIHWSQAREYIGERVRVYGEVIGTYFDWKEYERWVGVPEVTPPPTFLEIGLPAPHRERLRVVIRGQDRGRFIHPPDEQFEDATVIVSGEPYLHEDVVHIQVSDPDDITITKPIRRLYIDYFDPKFRDYDVDNIRVLALSPEEIEEHRRYCADWEDPELYGRPTTRNEWGEEVEIVDIPGTDGTMYFDEDNGWIVS